MSLLWPNECCLHIHPASAQKHFWNSSFMFPVSHTLLSQNISSHFQLIISPFSLDYSVFITPRSSSLYLFSVIIKSVLSLFSPGPSYDGTLFLVLHSSLVDAIESASWLASLLWLFRSIFLTASECEFCGENHSVLMVKTLLWLPSAQTRKPRLLSAHVRDLCDSSLPLHLPWSLLELNCSFHAISILHHIGSFSLPTVPSHHHFST